MNKELRKAYVYRLCPTPEQVEVFLEYSKATRFVFNWGLAQIKEMMEEQKKAKTADLEANQASTEASKVDEANGLNATSTEPEAINHTTKPQRTKLPTYFDFTSGGLTALKKTETWLSRTPCHTLQASYKDLDLAMKAFFRRVKAKEPRAGFPRFKNRYQDHAFRFPDPVKAHKISASHIFIPKIGPVEYIRGKYYDKRPITGDIKTMTIKKEGKHWFISLSCLINRTVIEAPDNEQATSTKVNFYVSPGNEIAITTESQDATSTIPSPNYYQRELTRLANVQKALSHKVKGSANRQRCIDRLGKIHLKIKNQRKDFLHKLSTKLVLANDILIVKDLPIKDMMKDEQFALAIGDVGWHSFVLMLKNKCLWYGKHFKED